MQSNEAKFKGDLTQYLTNKTAVILSGFKSWRIETFKTDWAVEVPHNSKSGRDVSSVTNKIKGKKCESSRNWEL